MMKTEISPERAKRALIAKLSKESAHIADLVRWGAWTLAAEYAASVAADALAVRSIELLPEPDAELFATVSRDSQLSIFSPAVSHHSSGRELPAADNETAGSTVFGGRA